MAEPTSTAGFLTLAGVATAVPVLQIFGVATGLRADILLSGFLGSVAAMGLLNTVPSSGDTLRELRRTSLRRVSVALCSTIVAGYGTPALVQIVALSDAAVLGIACISGAGAQTLLPLAIDALRAALTRSGERRPS